MDEPIKTVLGLPVIVVDSMPQDEIIMFGDFKEAYGKKRFKLSVERVDDRSVKLKLKYEKSQPIDKG